ncbi:MAG TPA: fibro-slime domain-containing protein, partial [Fibrobacteria bacterium]|nr:fibro-slime domain-containing protein [Fibrobacteria bacterium]
MHPASQKKPGNRAIPLIGAAILVLSAHAGAARTLMFLVDWWLNQPMDTVINLQVFQPTPEIQYLPTPATPPAPVKTNAYQNDTPQKYAWWYALPNFNANDYSQGRIRINTLYSRGWYQADSTYTMANDTVIDLSKLHILDTATTFTYRNPVNQRDTTIAIPAAGPKTVALPAGAWFKGPKLYTSAGNGGTSVLNVRPTTGTGMGSIDNCLDTIPGDTVWIRFLPSGQQQPQESSMSCTSYNPFSKLRARLYLRNPWPGSSPVVDWNGQQLQMYPSTSLPDWMVVDLRYIDTSATKPAINFRFQKSATSGEFFDASGVSTGIVQPFQEPGTTDGLSYYFVPPEGGGPLIAKAGVPALKPPYMLYVQDPWSPGTPRVVWPNDAYLRVMRPTQNCGWYSYPLYTRPVQMLIGHSYLDSIYGTAGAQFRTRSNWVTLSASFRPDSSVWVQTFGPIAGVRVPAAATTAPITKSCATDTLNLVMEAYDFKGRGDGGGNPSFQIGGWTDLTGAASTGPDPGMVQNALGANGLPVYTGRDSGYQSGGINGPKGNNTAALTLATTLWKKSTPSNWFDTTALVAAVPGIKIGHTCLQLPLIKTPADSGYYKYDNQSFFPLDTISDTRGVSLALAADNKQHNFSFCLQGHAAFEYTPGLQFEFRGDDDVWVFINNLLAIDLGGTHAPESTFVNVDKLHLVEGRVYPFDIFYCERQTNGSSIRIRTSMDLQPSWKFKDSLLPKTGNGATSFLIQGQMTQNYTPTCADLAAAARATWQPTSGQMVVVGPDGSDLYTIYSTDTTLYGGALVYANNTITVDTAALKLDPDLSWTGKYTILVQSLYGDPLDSISFTKSYGSHVVQGTVFDANGDGIADSIRLVAPAPIFLDNPSYHVVWFDASGKKDSLIVPVAQVNMISDSIVDVPLGGRNPSWGIRTALPPVKPDSLGGVLTHPGGMAAAVDNPIKLLDGIAPVADSAWLAYDTTGTGMDTLYVIPSEPVQGASVLPAASIAAWILDGKSTAPNLLPGVGIVSTDGLLIKLPLSSATDPIVPGDSVRLGGKLSDFSGNAPGAQSRWVPVLANAVAKSWMLDTIGLGSPDVIHISSRGSLASATSVTVHWKTASGADTTFSVATPGGLGTSLTLPSGILQNATTCSGCRIDVFTGTQSRSFALLDSVAPVAVSASYRYGTSVDTLVVVASEPLTKGSVAGENWVAQKAIGSASVSGTLVATGTSPRLSTDTLTFLVPTGTFTGDSLRLRGWSLDASGNVPGQSSGGVSKFVPVVFSAQPVSVAVYDENGDGRADSVVFSLTKSASGAPVPTGFTVQWGGQTISVSNLVPAANGLSWSGPIGPFAPGVTAPIPGEMGVIRVGSDTTTWRARVADSVAPVATKAVYRYGLTMDTLTVTASEQLVQGNAPGEGWVAQKNAPSQSASGTVAAGAAIGTPTNVLTLLVAPGAFTGDSLRLRAWSKDASGNAPGAVSPWVPVAYGPQPIRVQLFDENGDGRADSVVFRLARSANGVPVPDSFTVQWNGQTLSVKNLVRSADQLSWSGPIGPFAKGTAPAPGDAGWFDIGSDQTSYRAPVEDSVAPVPLSATLVFGFDPGSSDTLKVVGSEGLKALGTNYVLLNSDSSNTGAYLPTGAQPNPSVVSGTTLNLVVPSGSIPNDASWVRFGTSISDNGGATVGASSLWVKLVTRPSGRAYLYDSDGDGRADSVAVAVRGTLPATTAVLTWTDATGKADTRTWPVGPTSASFGIHPTTSSLWFAKGATSCPTNNCTISFLDSTGATLVTWPLVDSVAPMALSGSYTFGTTQDTLTVKFSEPLKQ